MIRVSVQTLRSATDSADDLPEAIHRGVTRAMQILRGRVQAAIREQNSVATGQLRRSVEGMADRDGADTVGILSMESHWRDVEYGTRPHAVPIADLLRWVQTKSMSSSSGSRTGLLHAMTMTSRQARDVIARHAAGETLPRASLLRHAKMRLRMDAGDAVGTTREREELRIAWAVHRKIALAGTDKRPFVGPSLAEVWPDMVRAVTAAIEEVGA